MAESLYLARYIEGVASGTQTMIELCREAGLPEPQFEQREGFFVTTIWRDWLTPEILAGMNLNERQVKAVTILRLMVLLPMQNISMLLVVLNEQLLGISMNSFK